LRNQRAWSRAAKKLVERVAKVSQIPNKKKTKNWHHTTTTLADAMERKEEEEEKSFE
jgi:hypothetical protein